MYFKLLIFTLIIIFATADVKPEIINKEDLFKKEITVEVIGEDDTALYKTAYGITLEDFLRENNLNINNDLNLTYTLADHDVINLKNSSRKSINEISLDELKDIPYISQKNAEDIINYRNSNGWFKTIDEAANIKGIGETKLKILKEYLTI